ncbi:MAG: ROK family protein [Rectinemataceae bacterium]|jgi:glucokinase
MASTDISEDAAFLGLDIGGQSVKGLRLEGDGKVSRRSAMPTPASSGAEAVLSVVAAVLTELCADGSVATVGAGTPGGVDGSGRIVGDAANISDWKGVDLRSAISRAAGACVSASVRNDGNLAAYAEWAVRGGASRALLFVGLGTGVGGGYIEEGRILGGVDDKALEIGHVIVYPEGRKCACGRSGCVEAYASGPSIGRLAVEMASRYDTPLALAVRSGADIDAREVYEAFAKADGLAVAVHLVVEEALSRVIGQALAFLAPDTVVLGGGVLAGAASLVADVARLAPRYVFAAASEGVRFEAALLGAEAGLLGAALYGASTVLSREELFGLSGRAGLCTTRPVRT